MSDCTRSLPWILQRNWPPVVVAVLLLGLGGVVCRYRSQVVEREFQQQALSQAVAVARSLDPDRVKALSFSPADENNPSFQQIQEQITAYGKAAGLRRVFGQIVRDGLVIAGPDSQASAISHSREPGAISQSAQGLKEVFEGGEPTVVPGLDTSRGGFLRALAPLRDPRTGRVLMVVGIEMDASEENRRIWCQQFVPMIFASALTLVLLGGRRLVMLRAARASQGWLWLTEPLVTACLGVLLTLAVSLLIRQREVAARRDIFLHIADSHTAALKAADRDIRDSLMVGMAKYLEDDSHILQEEFHYYVGSLVRSADLQALQWVPRVPAKEREKVEVSARNSGLTNFFIFERNKTGERTPVADREEYYPVLYAEPMAGNEGTIGFDVGSEPVRRAALEKTRRTGLPTATDPLKLREQEGSNSLLIFHPIFLREEMPASGWEEGRRLPVGYSLAAVGCRELLEQAFAYSASAGRLARVDWYQLECHGEPRLLASCPELDGATRAPAQEDPDHLSFMRPLFAFAKAYAVVVTPERAFLTAYPARAALVAAASGLVITAAATVMIGLICGSRNKLEQEVRTRTEMLRASEASYRRQFSDNQAVMLLVDPEGGGIVDANEAAERFYGHSRDRLKSLRIQEITLTDETQVQGTLTTAPAEKQKPTECQHRLADGTTRVVEMYSSVILFDKRRLLHAIIHDITDRKHTEARLQEVHQQLLAASHQAGMSEVATGVLHNVGNVLNSVNVSATLVTENLKKSKLSRLTSVADMLREHEHDLDHFLLRDPRGGQIPSYLTKLAKHLNQEQTSILDELGSLRQRVEHIKEIVAMQQSYARVSGVVEDLAVEGLIEDAIRMNEGGFRRRGVVIRRQYDPVPQIRVDRHKVLQILVNLLRNAEQAMDACGDTNKLLVLGIRSKVEGRIQVSVRDNGIGIAPENLMRIFSQGFTTKRDGHGFGLHSGALAAQQMGGSLGGESEGIGKGATFTLELPVSAQVSSPEI